MSLHFDGTNDRIKWSLPASADFRNSVVHSFSLWFRIDVVPANATYDYIMQKREGDGSGGGDSVVVRTSGATTTAEFNVCSVNGGGWGTTSATRVAATVVADTWYHICGVSTHAGGPNGIRTLDAAWFDGASMSTGGSSVDNGGGGGITIGARQESTLNQPFDGKIAHVCWWQGYTLTAEDASFLAKGGSPEEIATNSILAYYVDKREILTAVAGTESGTPAVFEDPPKQTTLPAYIPITRDATAGVTEETIEPGIMQLSGANVSFTIAGDPLEVQRGTVSFQGYAGDIQAPPPDYQGKHWFYSSGDLASRTLRGMCLAAKRGLLRKGK